VEVVMCLGRRHILLPGCFWHLVHPGLGLVLNNAFLAEGLCTSISLMQRLPGGEGITSPYAIRAVTDEKEQIWEDARREHHQNLPSRIGAIFLFDDKDLAERAMRHWFPQERRLMVPARIVQGALIHRGDSRWLDGERGRWRDYAARYWAGEMTSDPLPEVLVDGHVYFPGWREPPFGKGEGLPRNPPTGS
jgi:hypothetical protein